MNTRIIREPKPDSGIFYFVLAYPRNRDPLEFAATLYRSPLAGWADPDMIADITKQSPEPFFSYQYYLSNDAVLNGVHVDINVAPAWNFTLGSNAVTVIVVDDGMEGPHTDLWCDPQYFWVYDGFENRYPDTPTFPYVTDRHGTAVAGMIHGCHNSTGIAGIAPAANPGIVRIFRDTLTAPWLLIADGINAAWSVMEADVISNSWGCTDPFNPTGCRHELVDDAIDNATTLGRSGKGTVVVFSAGNNSDRPSRIGAVGWPAVKPNVIAVGAIDRFGYLTTYTPEGPELDIVAPSSHYTGSSCGSGDVVTTDRVGSVGCNDGPLGDPNYTGSFGGTSAAAPQVAGAAALIISLRPSLTRQEVTNLLLYHADPWGPSSQYGAGKLNVWASVAPLVTPPPPPPLWADIDGPTVVPTNYQVCFFHGRVLPGGGGTEPFFFDWYVNDQWVTPGENLDYGGPDPFKLTLRATDSSVPTPRTGEVTWYVGAAGDQCENPPSWP